MAKPIKVLSVNISSAQAPAEKPIARISNNRSGVSDNLFEGQLNQELSVLGTESIDCIKKASGHHLTYGDFSEDLTTKGLELSLTSPMDRLIGQTIELEVTRKGIELFTDPRNISSQNVHRIHSAKGILVRVIKPGILKAGDVLQYIPRVFRIQVVTLSDRAHMGEYEDRSGPRVVELINNHFSECSRAIELKTTVIPDDENLLRQHIEKVLRESTDILITTGGTGVGKRDITVDTIKPILTREIPGIMEMIRIKYGSQKPQALLSRSIAGFIDNTLVYTLPGSVNAVNEYMEEIVKTLEHLIYMRHGLDVH
jgi:molybdopterin adenylyltransferase